MSMKSQNKRITAWQAAVLSVIAVFLLILIVLMGIILLRPQLLFHTDTVAENVAAENKKAVQYEFGLRVNSGTEVKEKEESGEPKKTDILNILLCGIDAYENGTSTSGTQPHTDANVVISINFDEGTVDLTSILRDTFSTAPGYYGFYKFNSIFNIPGGLNDVDESMKLTCAAAEQWMGGISIPYYYAVDFQAVIDIVDAIGGIDYDVELPFEDMHYVWTYPGFQHLNGEQVMGYIRIRKAADGLDSSRANRQRKMLLAIFQKLKDENLLSALPKLIHAADSGIYTNMTLAQTAAIANYAMNQDSDKVRLHSLVSNLEYNYDWVLNFVKMEERSALLKEVYGIDAEPIGTCSEAYEFFLYDAGFSAMKHFRQAGRILNTADEKLEEGYVLSEEETAAYQKCSDACKALVMCFDSMSEWVEGKYDTGMYLIAKESEYRDFRNEMRELEENLRYSAEALKKEMKLDVRTEWNRSRRWDQDRDINEVIVDFA